jgi:uncharacterized protein
LALFVRPTGAASFDCGAATHPHEKLICAEPALSQLDDQLARAFDGALRVLSPEGKSLLRRGQQSWLALVRRVCPTEAPAKAEADDLPAACLAREYNSRLAQLDHAVQTVGPFRFMAVERFGALPTQRSARRFATSEIAYPRIDGEDGEDVRRWNDWIAQEVKGLDRSYPDTDVTVGFAIHHAARDLISAEISSFDYGHGAAHGMGDFRFLNYLPARGAPLQATDLFAADKPWVASLARRAVEQLTARAARNEIALFDDVTADALVASTGNPARWRLDGDGLTIQFALYEIAPYSEGMPKVTFPWADLAPYLVKDRPFQIVPRATQP